MRSKNYCATSAWHTWAGAGGPNNDVNVTIAADGSVLVQCSTQDLGTGERTVAAIVAAEVLGLDVKDITVRIGESQFGRSGGSGGSTTCPGTAPAFLNATSAARDQLFEKISQRLGANDGYLNGERVRLQGLLQGVVDLLPVLLLRIETHVPQHEQPGQRGADRGLLGKEGAVFDERFVKAAEGHESGCPGQPRLQQAGIVQSGLPISR